ncbi:hypothetical protein HK096_009720, partial [Nowakowskiella sp. JEL0078]
MASKAVLGAPVLVGTSFLLYFNWPWLWPFIPTNKAINPTPSPVSPPLLIPVPIVAPIPVGSGLLVFSTKFLKWLLIPIVPVSFLAWWKYFHQRYLPVAPADQIVVARSIESPADAVILSESLLAVYSPIYAKTEEVYAVIGGSTFVGSYVTKALLERGEKTVYVFDSSKGSNAWLWEDNEHVIFVYVDLNSSDNLSKAFSGKYITTVFNCIDSSSGPVVQITSNVIPLPNEPLSEEIRIDGLAEKIVLKNDRKVVSVNGVKREIRVVIIRTVSNIIGYFNGSVTGTVKSD